MSAPQPGPSRRRAVPRQREEPAPFLSAVRSKSLITADGVKIHYEMIGSGAETIVLANGLGGRLYSWEPIVQALASRCRFITWDYRGLFESGAPKRIRRLSIPDHAEDIRAVLDDERIESAVFIGWSMGVQVSLEFATLYPERVSKLVLLNGTHGHALETAFQPLFRIAYVNRLLHEAIDFLRARPDWVRRLAAVMRNRKAIDLQGRLLARLTGQPHLSRFMRRYTDDIFSGAHFANYLRLFQELDAHSVYHHLRDLPHPALVAYGWLDFLTPAYQSREIIRKMPAARGFALRTASHFMLLEHPDAVVRRIATFLDTGA